VVLFDPYKVKLKNKLNAIDLKFQIRQYELNEDKTITPEEKNWKMRKLLKEFEHDKFWTKKMVDLYDNIMKM
jgi:hypothetical protein